MLLLMSFVVLLWCNTVNLKIVSCSIWAQLIWCVDWDWVTMVMMWILVFYMIMRHKLLLWIMHVNFCKIYSSVIFQYVWRWFTQVGWHSFADSGNVLTNKGPRARFPDPVTTWLVLLELIRVSKRANRWIILTTVSSIVWLWIAVLVIWDAVRKDVLVLIVLAAVKCF
jgi:hypothetical protein